MSILPLLLLGLLQQGESTEIRSFDPTVARSPSTIERWGLREGLPQAQVNTITADALGQLWVGTYAGLASFDGRELRAFDGEGAGILASLRVLSLHADSKGALWVGTELAGVGKLVDGRFELLPTQLPQGGTPEHIYDILEANDGSYWIAYRDGILQVDEQGKTLLVHDGLKQTTSLALGPDGMLWVAGHGLRHLYEGRLELTYPGFFECVHVDQSGRVWAGSGSSSILCLENGQAPKMYFPEVDQGNFSAIDESPDGTLWFGGWNPVGYRDGEFFHTLSETDATPDLQLRGRALFLDREGTLWNGGGGLSAIRPRPFTPHLSEQYAGDTPRIAMQDRLQPDFTWIARYSGQLLRLDRSGELYEHPAHAQAMAIGSDGASYAVSRARGLVRLYSDHYETLLSASEFPEGDTLTLLEGREGWWWSCGGDLVHHATPGEPIRSWGANEGLDLGPIHKLAWGPSGELWIGARNGVAVLDETGEITRRYTAEDGLAMGEAREIYFRSQGSAWIGHYGGGISLIDPDGKISQVSVDRGLHENFVHRILEEPDGSLLLLGNRGISWLTTEDASALERDPSHRAEPRIFDDVPGIDEFEGMGGAMPAGSYTQNGDVALPALIAFAHFSPRAAKERLPAPKLKFLRLATNKRELEPNEESRIAAEDRGLLVQYRAITFVDPHLVRYQYMLEGRDTTWVDAGNREIAHYESLPYGKYRFLVRAANRDGVWSEVLPSKAIDFRAAWFELPWVWALALGTGAMSGFFLLRRRFDSQRRKRAELEHLVASRTAALAAARDRLETEVENRTQDLRQALASLRDDMARREELEAKLRQSERLESVGRLAGGIAHDFNNILTAVLGEADLGDMETSDAALRDRFRKIRIAGERAARLTRQMLAFSREQPCRPCPVEIDAAIRETAGLLRQILPSDIEFTLDLQAEDHCAYLDLGQFEQIVMNLALNARDAIDGVGKIEISTCVMTLGDGQVIELRIQDDGSGIPNAALPHIFDPFFTTKEPGRGTGLGLASVHGIVKQAGGSIEVGHSSELGTEFRLRFPLYQPQADSQLPLSREPMDRVTIALCDDEPGVLQVMARALEGEGYEVLAAPGPHQALELLQETDRPVDLLVTDAMMPGMTGAELAIAWRERSPHTRFAFVSGFSRGGLQASANKGIDGAYLAKPFRPEVFRAFVREQITCALEQADPGSR